MRLFFGLSLPEHVRAVTEKCAEEAQKRIPGRYARSENHHITLAFLGEVEKERLGDVRAVLETCIADFPAPLLTLDGFSHFGKADNGILILRVKSEPALDGLHGRLVDALHEANLPADPGPFSPHITLARHAKIGAELPDCLPICYRAERAHIYLSARDSENILRYTPLDAVSFINDGE